MPVTQAGGGIKAGTIAHFAGSAAPAGWLKANGAAVSRTAYAALFAAIGTTYGAGDGSTTFNLPDLRGEFLRGFDDGRGIDAGRVFGSAQSGQNASHTHTGTTSSTGAHTHSFTVSGDTTSSGSAARGGNAVGTVTTSSAGAHTHSLTINAAGGTEARPRNVAMLPCIKY